MRWIILVSGGLLAACTVQQPAPENRANEATAAAPAATPTTVATPAGIPTDGVETAPMALPQPTASTPPPAPSKPVASEAPFSDTSAQGAANLVQTYYALLGQKKFKQAHRLWGPSSDSADATFAAQFASYREYHAEVDAPGEIEGAAGSLYVEVPVRTYGVTTTGEKFDEPAVVTLRRVNNVDGATPAQLRWHITTIERPTSPH